MRIFWSMALALLVFAAVNVATAKTAEARVSCTHHYGCVEGKYARRPISGMSCRNTTNKRPGHRYHFFCSAA